MSLSANQQVPIVEWCGNRRVVSCLAVGLLVLGGSTVLPHSLCLAEDEDSGGIADESPRDAIIEAALRDSFLVLPIRTDLQRATGKKFGEAKVLVLINGVKVIQGEDEAIDAGVLKLSRIWKAIDPFAKSEPSNVVFHVWCGTYAYVPRDDGSWPASSILLEALDGVGRRIGFQDADVNLYFLNKHSDYYHDWERAVADFAPLPEEDDLDEQAVGDQQVRLYPVRTRLSRLLYHDADCVVYFVPPIDEIDITSAVETMRRCLPQLDLKKKEKVLFLNHWKDHAVANAIEDELMGKHIYRDLLGFDACIHMARN